MVRSLVIDYQRCTGCRLCELVCSLHHYGECNPKLSCIRVVSCEETGEAFPSNCANCSSSICMDLCPAKAIEIDPKSKALVINNEKCRGCKTCVTHCPLEVARFNEDSGVAFKCDLCGGDPVCAKFCPSGAIKFLALDEGLDTRGRDFMEQVAKATGETSKDST